MRGPIRTPILLPFGNRNTQAEPHRAVSWAVKRGQQRHAPPCSPGLSRRACDDVHRQAFLASPAVPLQTFRARSRLACHAFPCLPIPAFLTMPAVRCRASIAPDLATPCLPTPPFNATSYHACRTCPSAPSHACSTLPHQTQPCPRYLACHAPRDVPTRPSQPCLALARPHLASRALP
jgi:hypothetical protein